jgi:nicotinate-nucleotide pyrophosphorylase (carboxylating)
MTDLNALPLDALYRRLASGGHVQRLLELARDEDLGPGGEPGDITSRCSIPRSANTSALLVARDTGVVSGLAVLPQVVELLGPDVKLSLKAGDGERVSAGSALAFLHGSKRDVLAIERLALNLVGRLSGIASLTADYVEAAAAGAKGAEGVGARIYDTRKTTPGLRMLEKYAVRCGGGYCHRIGLYDGMLIKDNHLAGVGIEALAAFVADAAAVARKKVPDLLFIEVEVDTLEQFEALLPLERGTIDMVLLDNMTPAQLRKAVQKRNRAAPHLQLEASGGVRLETVAAIAATGVDRISIGALTHSAGSLDVALDILDESAGAPA